MASWWGGETTYFYWCFLLSVSVPDEKKTGMGESPQSQCCAFFFFCPRYYRAACTVWLFVLYWRLLLDVTETRKKLHTHCKQICIPVADTEGLQGLANPLYHSKCWFGNLDSILNSIANVNFMIPNLMEDLLPFRYQSPLQNCLHICILFWVILLVLIIRVAPL